MNRALADRDFLARWRLVVQLAVGSGLSDDVSPVVGQLVATIEGGPSAVGPTKLGQLAARHKLTIQQQRVLATVLVDRRGRLRLDDVCSIAWLARPDQLDWNVAMRELVQLEELGLVKSLPTDGESPRDTRFVPGKGLTSLSRIAASLARRGPFTEVDVRPPGPGPALPAPTAAAGGSIPAAAAVDGGGAVAASASVSSAGGAPAAPASPAAPARWPIRRWELELWAICFRTRQTFHRWIRAHHDPYKAFVGNYANAVDVPKAEALHAESDRVEEELTRPEGNAVERLQRTFQVGPAEARALLYLYLAETTDTGLSSEGRAVLAAIASDLLLAQIGSPAANLADLLFAPGSPLVKQGLVHVAASGHTIYTSAYQIARSALARIQVDPAVRPAAERSARPPTDGLGDIREPRVQLSDVILPEGTRDDLLDALALVDAGARDVLPARARAQLLYKGRGAVLLFEGPPGTGKTMAAEALAKHLGRRVFVARYDQVEDYLLGNSQKNIARLFDEADGAGAVLLLDEADALVGRRTPVHQAWDQHRNTLVNLLLSRLEEHDGVVILTTNLGVNLDPALERRLTARVRFGLPGVPEREKLWRMYLPDDVPLEGDADVPRLARQHPMSGARIRNAVLSALRRALRRRARETEPGPLHLIASEVVECAAEEFRFSYRDRSTRDDGADSPQVGDIRAPAFDFASVVLSDEHRAKLTEALVATSPAAKSLFESAAFLETFRTGRGVILMFEGPPGTGKTMTAEAVAGHLGKQIYLVTPERVLSKWYGQTERALGRLFDEAAGLDAVLVIDEADSLLEARADAAEFGSRTANNMVNLLLRRIEEFTGVAILITNRPAHLDPALERRLSARLVFAPPDAAQRAEILRRHLPPGVSLAPDVDLAALARDHALSGGRLRNAVLTALRRTLARDPACRVLSREALEEGLRDAADTKEKTIGFR